MVSIEKKKKQKNTAHGHAQVWEYLQMAFTTVQNTVAGVSIKIEVGSRFE